MRIRHIALAFATIVTLLIGACGAPTPAATAVPVSVTVVVLATSPTPLVPTPTPLPPANTPLATSTAGPSTPTPTALPPAPTPTAAPAQLPIAAVIARLQGLPLDEFLDLSYQQLLLRNPEWLTYLGLSEQFGLRNDQLNNLSDAYIRDTQKLEAATLAILRTYDRAALSPDEQISYDVYEWYLDSQVRGHEFMYCDYPLHHFLGSYDVELIRLFTDIHPLAGQQDVEDYVTRLSRVDDQVAQLLAGLKLREQAGIIPPRFIIEMTLLHLREIAIGPADAIPFYTAFADKIGSVAGMSFEDEQAWQGAVAQEVDRSVIPAFQALSGYFQALLKVATDDPGLGARPNGEACYAYLLRRETTTDLTAAEIHAIGLSEVERIQSELRQAFDQLGYPAADPLSVNLERAIQEAWYYYAADNQSVADQVVPAYEALLDEVSARLPEIMDFHPRGKVVVIGDMTSGGFYVPGSLDGSRPGAFHTYVGGAWVSKFDMPTTAYHEAIPGHGLQSTIAQELDLPLLRNDLTFNGYIEGWALYAERLAWEMGLYAGDPYGNIGRLQMELLRAVRLVTDTGVHRMGWTRAAAKAYMNEAMGDPRGRWSGEVDRYIVEPAQATSYKIGMLKMLELRQRAMDKLGDRFDLVEFHRVLLGNGSLPLPILEPLVDEYIAASLGR